MRSDGRGGSARTARALRLRSCSPRAHAGLQHYRSPPGKLRCGGYPESEPGAHHRPLGGRPHRQARAALSVSVGMSVSAEGPSPEEIQVPVLESVDRAITGLITGVPPLLLLVAGWQLWNRELRWRDVVIFAVLYGATGLGVTVGFHRLLTHRSFKTSRWLRGVLAVLGT